MKKLHSINKEHGLYVFREGNGYSCLGFDVVINRVKKLSDELRIPTLKFRKGSKNALNTYYKLVNEVYKMNKKTGYRSNSDLTPEFIGHEGRRVEVVRENGTRERFIIGKSTGWIPEHLEIKRRDSRGGGTVTSFASFKFI
jgi:hypothetical protein